jgi:hypothetical protein
MTTDFLLYLGIGRLFIYLGMKFPPFRESKIEFIKKLFSCDECLGVWTFTVLSFLMGEVLFRDVFYVPFISELATGGITSLLVHLIVIGWREKFGVITIE